MRHAPKNDPRNAGGRSDELPPSSLRGRLCEVFFSALLTEMIDPLMRRLGDKAELDDPVFGAAAGLGPLRERLIEWTRFLAERDATYDRTITVVGADRDVTEGTLEVRVDGQHRMVPIALLMERRREREVALRVYCATSVLGIPARGPTAGARSESAVPSFAGDLLAALAKNDAAAAAACFEQDSGIRDAVGAEHPRDAATRLLSTPMTLNAVADNGQACALEVALGGSQAPRLGLLVLQRGDSGLVRSLRIYSET
jgi:hypothetical protein